MRFEVELTQKVRAESSNLTPDAQENASSPAPAQDEVVGSDESSSETN